MCPSGGWGGREWDWLWQALGDSRQRGLQLGALILAVCLLSLLLSLIPYSLVIILVCLAPCWGYLNTGRLRSAAAAWRPLTSFGAAFPGKRPGLYPHRRQRVQSTFKWSPTDLLFAMGSYLGKQEPPARGVGRGARDIKEKLARPNPSVPTPTRCLSFRETPALPSRNFMSPRRRYPTHQPQYNITGSLPMVCLDGYQRKTLLSPRNSVVRSPVTVKIARPDSNIAHSPVLDHLLSPSQTFPSAQNVPDPCAKETVLNAIRESRKRMNKDEEYSVVGMEIKRRRQFSSGSGWSPSESHLVNGTLSSVSKADNLKRGLTLPVLDDHTSKRSRTSSNSSVSGSMIGVPMPAHNAITSSYSSSIDMQKRKRNPNTSLVSSTPSSRCQTPEWPIKKAREEEKHESNASTPVKSDSRDQSSGMLNETPVSKKSSSINLDTGGGGRRRKALLVCPGRNEQYPLPPPPLMGYSITSKDFDSEKKAALQRLNKALEENSVSTSISSAPASTSTSALQSLLTFTQATSSLSSASQTSTTSSNPLLQSLAKMQNQESSPVSAPAVTGTPNISIVTTTVQSMPLGSFALNLNTSEAKPSITSNSTLSFSAPAPAVTISGSSTLSQPLSTAQAKPESPKNGLLLEILSKNKEDNPQTSFKPIFGASTPTVPLSSADIASTSNSSTATTFKPIFGNLNSKSASTPFMFPMTASSATPVPSFPSGTAASLGNDTAAKPTLVLSNSTATTSSTTAPTFQFGAASQSLSSSGTTPVLGSHPLTAPQTKPTAPFGQTPTTQHNAGLNIFGGTPAAPVSTAQAQPPTAFGSTTSAFTATFGSTANSFSSTAGPSAFNSSTTSEVQANKSTPAPLPNFGSSVSQQPAFAANTQPAFGSSLQPAFGASTQQTFGATANSTFNFGASTPAATKATTFGTVSSTQSSTIAPNTNLFGGGTQQSSLSFGGATNPSLTFGSGTQSNSTGGSSGFNFGGAATQTSAPASAFGSSSVTPNSIGTPNQSTPFSFGTAENKLPFVGSSTPTFGQSTSTPGALPFGAPAAGFSNPNPSFSPAAPSFSIGSCSKPSGARQRLQARRQHPRKK